jgi:hypothetical protein
VGRIVGGGKYCRGVVQEVEGLKRWKGGVQFGGMNFEGSRNVIVGAVALRGVENFVMTLNLTNFNSFKTPISNSTSQYFLFNVSTLLPSVFASSS